MINLSTKIWNNLQLGMTGFAHKFIRDASDNISIYNKYIRDNSEWIVLFTGLLMIVTALLMAVKSDRWRRKYNISRNRIKLMKSNYKMMNKKLASYDEWADATREYYDARQRKELASLKKQLVDSEERYTIAEEITKKNEDIVHQHQEMKKFIEKIEEILMAEEYTNEECLAYDDDEEWPLYRLKDRAKELNMNLLSKYRWDSRRALSSAIRSREQLASIADVLAVPGYESIE